MIQMRVASCKLLILSMVVIIVLPTSILAADIDCSHCEKAQDEQCWGIVLGNGEKCSDFCGKDSDPVLPGFYQCVNSGTPGYCGPGAKCKAGTCTDCPTMSYKASLNAKVGASMAGITGEWFPLEDDAIVETSVELNDVSYLDEPNDHYAGLPKTIVFNMKIGVAYYDWKGDLNVNLFDVFRAKVVNALKTLGDKMGISDPPLYKSLISNKDIIDKIPSGLAALGDDSTWIEENMELKKR